MKKASAARLVLALVLITFSACECDDVVNQLPTPDAVLSNGNERTPPLPHLEVSLPPVVVGAEQSKDLDLWNEGDGKLEVTDVFLSTDPELCPARTGAFSVTGPAAGDNGLRAFSVAAGEREVISVVFTPTSAVPSCAVLVVHTDDEDAPVLRALLTSQGDAAALCTDDALLDFGTVFVGSTSTKTATLTSCGTRPIILESVSENEFFPPFSVEDLALPITLAAGESLEIDFEFAPTSEASYALPSTAGLFTVVTDGTAYQLALVGNAEREPSCELTAVPVLMNFGQVADGRSATQNLALQNRGQLECTVSAFALQQNAGPFSYDVDETLPLTLAPGATHVASVTFAPGNALGSHNDVLAISSDDPISPELEIPLEGNAIEATPCLLEASPTGVNFGNSAIGQSDEVVVTLTNVGTENCSVKEIVLTTGSPDFSAIADTFPFIGSPGV
ncbi:MAG: choice-of-anchor D domain-containing protein [Deltaproteobacteria bacterium]|nr:choice-of-anchor D domain-containing protein [Deltaproteobacteria bacterium]